jgi:undecaprenyl diphosphate synthase
MHVGIIMDGNGRWATARGLLRSSGHRAGAEVVRRIVEAAAEEKVHALTLYAFSSDNWQRPRTEVAAVMALLKRHLATELPKCLEHGIRLNVIGRRSRLDRALLRAIDHAERTTAGGRGMLLRLAVDYSARQAIAEAALSTDRGDEPFEQRLAAVTHSAICPMDLDLLIRTGGERRLSDFLLWESAYAELVFSDTLWPDYTADELRAALAEFACRERRFGGIAPSVAPARMDGVVADPRADLQRQAVR